MQGGGEGEDGNFGRADRKAVFRRALEAFRGRKQDARISFASPELLFRVLTMKRWEIVRVLAGAGLISIRDGARRVERDVKAVHSDTHALLNVGILRRTEEGRIECFMSRPRGVRTGEA